MERVAFLKMEIVSREFNNTGTLFEEETTKPFTPSPQAPKKLQRVVSNE
jgi:hypothetical protein